MVLISSDTPHIVCFQNSCGEHGNSSKYQFFCQHQVHNGWLSYMEHKDGSEGIQLNNSPLTLAGSTANAHLSNKHPKINFSPVRHHPLSLNHLAHNLHGPTCQSPKQCKEGVEEKKTLPL